MRRFIDWLTTFWAFGMGWFILEGVLHLLRIPHWH
jgi:hypothetical protein